MTRTFRTLPPNIAISARMVFRRGDFSVSIRLGNKSDQSSCFQNQSPSTGKITWEYSDRVVLLGNSNLQVQDGSGVVLWQSFDFPSDTLVENQNFTANIKPTFSNGLYSMKLGDNHIGLYMNFDGVSNQIY
uniref:Bulb-type lectin domain-containing protein n=1 Tax=Nelumbo nucifera TaxID=4432 RepID=A0A822XFL3_NELNU|nr:TPA_asm: hypothetical protein HUJ06_021737 [Nelumbo nucifera]